MSNDLAEYVGFHILITFCWTNLDAISVSALSQFVTIYTDKRASQKKILSLKKRHLAEFRINFVIVIWMMKNSWSNLNQTLIVGNTSVCIDLVHIGSVQKKRKREEDFTFDTLGRDLVLLLSCRLFTFSSSCLVVWFSCLFFRSITALSSEAALELKNFVEKCFAFFCCTHFLFVLVCKMVTKKSCPREKIYSPIQLKNYYGEPQALHCFLLWSSILCKFKVL